MINQLNIQQLFSNLDEWHYSKLSEVYQTPILQQYHMLILQIKTKFPIPNRINEVEFPTQENAVQFFQNYKPMTLQMSQVKDVKIKLYKNAAYFGNIVDGYRQGKGILIKQTLHLYEGQFEKDKKEGIGFEILKSNQYYYGNYVNGLPQGEGIFWSKSQKYIGQWHQGKKHGIGLYQGIHQDYYMGQWDNGKCCGSCLHVNGFIFVGEVTNDLNFGVGKKYLENGDFYSGEFRNGKPNGKGEYIWSNGNCYQGEFENGLRNGYGIWQSKTQNGTNCYKGYYTNDKKCGEGRFEYSNGTVYVGNFMEDKRCGYGEIVWSDKAIYKGYWRDGLMDGEGVYQYDQLILKGNWKQNQLQTFDKVRISLNEFPQQQQIKEIQENQEIQSEIADEPDLDQIGDQFQNEIQESKAETVIQNISHNTSHHDMYFHPKQPILQKQFDLLSLLDESLQFQSLESSKRQHKSSVAIQTESKKKFLPKLSMKKQHPTQFNINHSFQEQRNRKSAHLQYDVSQGSPQVNGNGSFHQTEGIQGQAKKNVNRSIQYGRKRHKPILLSTKEQNVWAIKMSKLKLSPAKYCRLWNQEVVNEIKQFLYPPVWMPPSYLL
ncbi:unnamed protein product (macronuclear) [Paramecium tetraurelia]|uniref:MORN repeat protein n=1 Tax=Paramecium tetraurelia TaxID=5888 RepID=A0C1E6_PARTE|nr:uncharacterized protein GSPATT00034089001 [Paramecium tetraurelia]CAK64613.1 unnamed protein product [Paramecium tetraurelia]|eukprot:XP_001432011.1 hypothetical protein (macronuclear) [Paramecium tetraurelia strain d4-2]